MKAKPVCDHRRPKAEFSTTTSGSAECRDCGMVSDFYADFDEWLDPEEYDRRVAAEDAWWAKKKEARS